MQKIFLRTGNDLAFMLSEVHLGNPLLKNPASEKTGFQTVADFWCNVFFGKSTPGGNPTIVSYNASAVKIYNATNV
jgi:hypothetical protein